MSKPNTSPARGMRDFLPADVRRRDYVIGVIREVYAKYGYEPLETPSIENLETLTNKYGDEGNQLMFKILKRGEKLEAKLDSGEVRSENELSDLALRYDLTVPLARVIANYRNELPRLFKRYQIQPVWRADRPARGRYREFYQCDVDAIGSSSLAIEAEQCAAVCEILERLGFEDFQIRINHRELLKGILANAGVSEQAESDALVAIDKLDKIGVSGVLKELQERGVEPDGLTSILEFADSTVSNQEAIAHMSGFVRGSDRGEKGLAEVGSLLAICGSPLEGRLSIDPTLARGLSYYTGMIFEIRVPDLAGSLGGGGRYDGLIGMFGKEEIPACGFSLGLERIILILEEEGLFPEDVSSVAPADVMVAVWNEETLADSFGLASELRAGGVRVLLYPQADKLGKQFKYADQIGVPLVCIAGEKEIEEGTVSLKNMKTGDQETIVRSDLLNAILGKSV